MSIFGCFFGHDWAQWEQYTYEGTVTPIGIIYGEQRGKTYEVTESRQRRKCQQCGYAQDEEV
jgi:hypothetical protein